MTSILEKSCLGILLDISGYCFIFGKPLEQNANRILIFG